MFMAFFKSTILALVQICYIYAHAHTERKIYVFCNGSVSFCTWLVLYASPSQLLLATVGIRQMNWTDFLKPFLLSIITDHYLFFLISLEPEVFGVSLLEASKFLFRPLLSVLNSFQHY